MFCVRIFGNSRITEFGKSQWSNIGTRLKIRKLCNDINHHSKQKWLSFRTAILILLNSQFLFEIFQVNPELLVCFRKVDHRSASM